MSLVEMSLTVLLICSRKITKMIDSIERAYCLQEPKCYLCYITYSFLISFSFKPRFWQTVKVLPSDDRMEFPRT